MATPKKATRPTVARGAAAKIEEANIAVVKNFFEELVTKKDPKGVEGCLSDDFISHSPDVKGRQGMADFAAWQAKNQPDAANVEVFHLIGKGDMVIYHYTYSSDPANKGAELAIVDFFRVRDGKIVEYWDIIQTLAK